MLLLLICYKQKTQTLDEIFDVVRTFFDVSADVMLRRGDKLNKTAELCTAARTGQLETLQRASKSALNRCTDDNDNDDVMMTPAMCAATHGQLAALRVIVERGYAMTTFTLSSVFSWPTVFKQSCV